MQSKSKFILISNILISILLGYLLIQLMPLIEFENTYRNFILGSFIILCFFCKSLIFQKLIKTFENISKVKEFSKTLNLILVLILGSVDQSTLSLTTIVLISFVIDFIVNIEFLLNIFKMKNLNNPI